MSDATNLAKVLVVVGLLVVLTTTLPGGATPAGWTNIENAIAAGIAWPAFWNPFTQETVTVSAYADAPVDWGFANGTSTFDATVVGCGNTTGGRVDCLTSADGDTSYIEVQAGVTNGFFFNYSNSQFRAMNGTSVVNIRLSFQCRTVEGDSSAYTFTFTFMHFDNGAGDEGNTAVDMFCPKGGLYQTVSQSFDFENGLPYTLFEGAGPDFGLFEDPQAWLSDLSALFNPGVNIDDPIARFTYFRIDLVLAAPQCAPPEGAWFPIVDEIACAITNFANFVWRGIQFIASGFAFIILTVSAALVFLGTVVANFFLGLIDVFGSISALGAPSPVQEFLNVSVIAMAGFLVFSIVKIVRGNE